MAKYSTEIVNAVIDCAVIAFYYLLWVGEYTVLKKETKQKNGAVQVGRYNFFRQAAKGHLRQLPINALDKDFFP